MTGDKSRRIEVKDEDQTVAAAEVAPVDDSRGTVRTSLYATSEPPSPGTRTRLLDAIMDTPEVQNSAGLLKRF